MDSPFFRSRRFQSKLPSDQKIRRQVAQIPVQSVGSESKTWSALKIQKKFRGFLVRTSVKRIKAIKIQVDDIEGMLLKSEVVELIRKDARERVKMNEGLMALLLKLDSIPGVDSGVRDCRKAVIRRAIALQERIDAIASVNLVSSGENTDEDEGFKEPVTLEIMNSAEDNSSDGMMDLVENNSVKFEDSEKLEDSAEFRNSSVGSLIEKNEQKNDDWVEVECPVKEKVGSRIVTRDDNKRNCEVLERMMEDNKKMMRLMTQLFERNEMQTSMLSDLTHRVGQLEKAFTCDRLSRMKKKKLAVSRAE